MANPLSVLRLPKVQERSLVILTTLLQFGLAPYEYSGGFLRAIRSD